MKRDNREKIGLAFMYNRVLAASFCAWVLLILRFLFSHVHSKVPAFLNVVDIAGLVKGAAEGQGLGNAFLSHISACDGIFHLCREYILNLNIFFAFCVLSYCGIRWI